MKRGASWADRQVEDWKVDSQMLLLQHKSIDYSMIKGRVFCIWWDINIDSMANFFRKKGNALRLVRSKRNNSLWSVETGRNCQLRSLSTAKLSKFNDTLHRKRSEWNTRHEHVILQHNTAPCHRISIIRDTIKTLKWNLLPHPLYITRPSSFKFSFVPFNGAQIRWLTLDKPL